MSLTDLIGATYLEQGRAAAQAAANKGQIWGGAIRSLGQIPQVMEQQKAAEQERQIRAQQLQMGQMQMAGLQKAQQDQQKADQVVAGLPRNADGTFNTPEVLQQLSANGIGSEEQKRRAEYLDAVNKIILSSREQKADQNADLANALLEYHKGSNEPLSPEDVHSIISVGKLAGFATPQDEQDFLDLIASNPDPLKLLQATRDSSKKYRDLNKPVVVQQGGSLVNPQTGEPVFRGTPRPVNVPPGGTLINPDTGETVATGAPREPAPKGLQTKSVLLDGKPAEVVFDPADGKFKDASGQDVSADRIKPIPPAAATSTPQQERDVADVVESVKGMKDGSIPPILPSRASREYAALMAEAHRQGVNLVKLNEDWQATQKYLGTLNGQQQVRLRQAINFTKESLPLIEDLARQWDAGKFPLLNKANLVLAKNGAFGQAAAGLATKLDAQISDLTSELGTVYKGGNSSTDESLSLAAKNLQANWSKQTMLDNIAQIRRNLEIREHSIQLGQPVANEGNPYAPTTGAAPTVNPVGRFNPATGKVEPIGAR